MRLPITILSCVALAAACAHAGSELTQETVTNARIAPAGIKPGDCVEARRRAALQPDLDVDRLPAPVSQKPPALQRVPSSALRKDGSAEVKVDVLIDTLGRADMRTFTVVRASSPWLVSNVQSVIGKWRFSPAELAGCKVPRIYHFMASATGVKAKPSGASTAKG